MELYVRSRCDYGIMEFVFGGGAMYPETERLYMRKLAPSDHDALCAILKDEATSMPMRALSATQKSRNGSTANLRGIENADSGNGPSF